MCITCMQNIGKNPGIKKDNFQHILITLETGSDLPYTGV